MHPKRRARWRIVLSGQKTNSSCWRQQQIWKPRMPMKRLIWNLSRTNTHRFQIYPKKAAENVFSTIGELFMKDRIAPKIKQLRYKYRKTLKLGTQSGAGRPNRRFFCDICSEIWRRSWATESFKPGIENTWRKYFKRDKGRRKRPIWRTLKCTQRLYSWQ